MPGERATARESQSRVPPGVNRLDTYRHAPVRSEFSNHLKRSFVFRRNRIAIYELHMHNFNKLMFTCESCSYARNVLCEALV